MEQSNNKAYYTVQQLAKLAGVSVRTLHLYDRIGLLTPAHRTEKNYRKYGEAELLRLQQILFYKELDMPLKQIANVLDDPDFDLLRALDGHKNALLQQRNRLNTLLRTIDKTIAHLKQKTMDNYEELYEGLHKEQLIAWRQEAIDKWGEDAVLRSEQALKEMNKIDIEQLKADQEDIRQQLAALVGEDPTGDKVQEQIARHYANIRSFWGVTDPTDLRADTYKGLAELYVTDERYTAKDDTPNPALAQLMRDAMMYFADTKLKG